MKVTLTMLITFSFLMNVYFDTYRPWSLNWGATDDEINRYMIGDENLQNPTFSATRAVTIKAQPEDIWPWIVQMGYRKAGFYSYDKLDNDGIPSSNKIIPEYQNLKVGDHVPMSTVLHAEVTEMNPYESMLWVFQESGGPFSYATWAWELIRIDGQHTRMLTRLRVNTDDPTAINMLEIGEIHMMRKCMLGIQCRAECMTE